MSLHFLITLGVCLLVMCFLAQAFFLWAAARLFRIRAATFRGSLLIALLTNLAGLILGGFSFRADKGAGTEVGPGALVPLLWLLIAWPAVNLALPWVLVIRFFQAPRGRAAVVVLTMLVAGTVFAATATLGFRRLIVEPFAVPTGAMAPTMYGMHADVTCENCTRPYAITLSDRLSGSHRMSIGPKSAVCPSCGWATEIPISVPAVWGDRILVDKLRRPERWDIIAFEYPVDPSDNYVKRLVGMPGETVGLASGDLFINGRRMEKPPGVAEDMWIFLHDTVYVPATPAAECPRWEPVEQSGSPWYEEVGRWTCKTDGNEPAELVFRGLVTDHLAYNGVREIPGTPYGRPSRLDASTAPVGDIKIACTITMFSGDGDLDLSWDFHGRTVHATFAAAGQVKLTAVPAFSDGTSEVAQETAEARLSGPLGPQSEIGLAVRDGYAYVLEENQPIASLVVAPQKLEAVTRELDEPSEGCRLSIVAHRCHASIGRIRLWKDVYYRRQEEILSLYSAPGTPDMPITLGENEYFTLGDNSNWSYDSRYWGSVRKEALIGVARWIYWPPRRWHEFR